MGLFGKSDDDAPTPFEVAGRSLRCVVCGTSTFWHRRAQLQGGVASFFNVEWASPTADCAVCSACGYVHWFLPLE